MTTRLRNKRTGVVISVPEGDAASFRKRGYVLVRGKAVKPVVDVEPDGDPVTNPEGDEPAV